MQDRSDPASWRGRLPLIAPREGQGDTRGASGTPQSLTPATGSTRAPRLPPRSRNGCWTCRQRKVKCDETRPICKQCSRLQHTCDYSPRIGFKDDTPHIVERMQEVSISGNSVWDPNTRTERSQERDYEEDELPPFADLTNDEDRERKAGSQQPGTFHVVAVQESFESLPEYSKGKSPARPPGGDLDEPRASSTTPGSTHWHVPLSENERDPNVVILKSFEDTGRRMSLPQYQLPHNIPRTSASAGPSEAHTSPTVAIASSTWYPRERPPRNFREIIERGGPDARLLDHYLEFVVTQMTQTRRDPRGAFEIQYEPSNEMFEQQAMAFKPLYHAICALSALSLSNKQPLLQNLEGVGLQHYHSSLSLLQTNEDLTPDYVFFTHFFLFIYDICAAAQFGSNMWSTNLRNLLRIVIDRKNKFGREPYPLLVYWISSIDVAASMTGNGPGQFVNAMFDEELIPSASTQVELLGNPTFRASSQVMELSTMVNRFSARLGRLAFEVRQVIESARYHAPPNAQIHIDALVSADVRNQLFQLQTELRGAWASQYPQSLPPNTPLAGQQLTGMMQLLFEHAYLGYRSCMIFSFTSIWPGQRAAVLHAEEAEMQQYASEIIQLGHYMIQGRHTERRFLAFPLFMAGFASTREFDYVSAMAYLRSMEPGSLGRNTAVARQLLQVVHELQGQYQTAGLNPFLVDWIEVKKERGMDVVNFGL